ncbi:MAG TPA: acyl-ACP--UDP-N-acetylglucosamine O-acyltransferase [Gammaproteobacteria bacterium]|nr:acyl-ACP--UDP-N-acetylglucosamine O-acyltransferase [Gammaproteobacteria bacterium]
MSEPRIDERAVVDPGARVGEGVSVGPYSVIGPDVEIGAGTWIGPHVVVRGPTRIGAENRIFQFASVGEEPQDKKYRDEPTGLEIGDRNTIREYVTINRGTTQDRGATTIGNDNWIMAYVHIAHDCVIGDDIILANAVTLAGHVTIDSYANLGGFTKVHQFCRVGRYSFCGMDTGLTRDVPPFVMASGMPAQPFGINSEGLRRRGFSAEQVANIKRAYRLLYRSGLRLEEAREQLAERAQKQPELAVLVEFLEASERGIIR